MSADETDSPDSHWKWSGGVFILVGLWIGIRFLLEDDSFAILGLLAVTCGAGLWFQQQWARWGTIALCVTMVMFYAAFRILGQNFNLMTVVVMLGSLYGAWDIWRNCRKPTALEQAKNQKPMISLVLLLRKPRYLEARVLAKIASSAWGEEYSCDEQENDSSRWVVGETPLFLANAPEGIFIINNFDRQYFENMQDVLDNVEELRLHKAIRDHNAWLSVDLVSLHDKDASAESVYPRIATLVAELAGPDCVALLQPETGRINVWEDALEEQLRGPDCLEVFGVETNVPVIRIDDDDPRMMAAVEQARLRWPEFVEAFKKRDGENFSVKAPVTVDDRQEFIWIEVVGLEPEYIYGTLANDPVDLGDLKLGDHVEVSIKEINDWAFIRDGDAVGMFTVKVISETQRQKQS